MLLWTPCLLEVGLPVCRYQVGTIAFEKRVLLPHRQNTVYVNYRLVEGSGPVRLIQFRPIRILNSGAPIRELF